VGEMRLDQQGRPRPDGYRMRIEPSEAQVVLRIFREFGNEKAVESLVKELNAEEIRGKRKLRCGWSPSTVSRILKNDALKPVSCMTLFQHVAKAVDASDSRPRFTCMADHADAILAGAAAQGYPRCTFTEECPRRGVDERTDASA